MIHSFASGGTLRIRFAVTYPGFGWLMDRLDWPLAFVASGAALVVAGFVWGTLAADDPALCRGGEG